MSRMPHDYLRRRIERVDWVEFFGSCLLVALAAVAGVLLAVELAH